MQSSNSVEILPSLKATYGQDAALLQCNVTICATIYNALHRVHQQRERTK